MSRDDFTLTATIDAAPEQVYAAVATRDGIAAWWTKHHEFDGRAGSVAEMRFPEAGFWAKFRVTALEPPTRVEWECIDSIHPKSSGYVDLKEWNGTSVRFEIEPAGKGRSRLRFTHVGLVPDLECNEQCRSIWSFYINTSLRKLLEEGRGEPFGA